MARRGNPSISKVRSAAKVLREIGGTPAPDLVALLQQALGWPADVHRLADQRVLVSGGFFTRQGQVHESETTLRAFVAGIEARMAKPMGHPLGEAYPDGDGFIDAVPDLIAQLPGRLGIPAARLDGSVDGLSHLDRAARSFGGQACLDDPALLAGLVAYVGEVARNVGGGSWAIDDDAAEWEPVVMTGGAPFRPFIIFKELLEDGSMCAVVGYHLGWTPGQATRRQGVFGARAPAVAAAVGALATLPAEAYAVVTRYGDGLPWQVHLSVDVEIGGLPLAGGTDAHVTRGGFFHSGVLSRPHTVLGVSFPAGTTVSLRAGRFSGVTMARLGADHVIQGVPCQAGCRVEFHFHRGQPALAVATLAAPHTFDGVTYPAGTWVSLDRDGRLQDERQPG